METENPNIPATHILVPLDYFNMLAAAYYGGEAPEIPSAVGEEEEGEEEEPEIETLSDAPAGYTPANAYTRGLNRGANDQRSAE